jgi:uncharacterized RDD family membrane protein YckC
VLKSQLSSRLSGKFGFVVVHGERFIIFAECGFTATDNDVCAEQICAQFGDDSVLSSPDKPEAQTCTMRGKPGVPGVQHHGRSVTVFSGHNIIQNCGTNSETTMNPIPTGKILYCSQCGQAKSEQELAHFGDILVCGACKPAYAQGLGEGVAARAAFHYAGFWIRFVAIVIDGLIVGFSSAAVQAILLPGLRSASSLADRSFTLALVGLAYVIGVVIGATYEGVFVNKLGATPGKLALGLRVVRPDGGPVSLGRAVGRYFAKILSAMILLIGYIMAGFDREKRALHDMIVDTRVIRKRS